MLSFLGSTTRNFIIYLFSLKPKPIIIIFSPAFISRLGPTNIRWVCPGFNSTVEFAGMIANGRVFRGDKGRYVTFLTLGVGNGQYIDVTIKKAFAYSDHDVVWGQGTIRHSNNSDYVECFDSKGFRLEKFINN